MMINGRLSELYGKDDKEDRDDEQGLPGKTANNVNKFPFSHLWTLGCPKSWLLAIISPAEKEPTTGSNKLQRKTNTWGNFEGAIE